MFRRDRGFCDFDPPNAGGRKQHITGLGGREHIQLNQQSRYIHFVYTHLPVARAVSESLRAPPPGRGRYPDPRRVAQKGSHILKICQYNISLQGLGPRPIVWHPIAKRRGEPGRKQRKPRVPKKEIRSGARGELAMLGSKIKHCQLKSRPFRAAFSGMNRVLRPSGDSIFFNFYFANFCGHTFRMGQ